jgi:hypothetical protein
MLHAFRFSIWRITFHELDMLRWRLSSCYCARYCFSLVTFRYCLRGITGTAMRPLLDNARRLDFAIRFAEISQELHIGNTPAKWVSAYSVSFRMAIVIQYGYIYRKHTRLQLAKEIPTEKSYQGHSRREIIWAALSDDDTNYLWSCYNEMLRIDGPLWEIKMIC